MTGYFENSGANNLPPKLTPSLLGKPSELPLYLSKKGKLQVIMVFFIRLYLSALTLIFLLVTSLTGSLKLLQGVIITCSLLFLILDTRIDFLEIKQIKSELTKTK